MCREYRRRAAVRATVRQTDRKWFSYLSRGQYNRYTSVKYIPPEDIICIIFVIRLTLAFNFLFSLAEA